MSDGDLSGMDKDVVDERVVAIDAVVASSNDGGVQGRRSGRPGRKKDTGLVLVLQLANACFFSLSSHKITTTNQCFGNDTQQAESSILTVSLEDKKHLSV